MEIISKIIEININPPYNSDLIEKELLKMDIIPLRWAIVKVSEKDSTSILTISLACENL